MKKTAGYTLLNALLGVTLLTGIVYLIMHTMTQYHSAENAHSIGENLAPIVAEAIVADITSYTLDETYPLVAPSSSSACQHANPIFVPNIAPGYLQSLAHSGFDLAQSACVVISR